jgi:hypothetical protein
VKTSGFPFLTFAIAVFLIACSTKKHRLKGRELPPEEDLYLGQKPPGLIPEAFAPGIVTTEHAEFFGNFSPDLKEFYFKRKGGKYKKSTLVVIQYKNGRWLESVVSPPEASVGEPSISPDGNIIYLGSSYIERTDSGWSAVKDLGIPFKDITIMRLTASDKGTYVFDEREEIGTIRYSRWIDGRRETPKAFGKEINTGKWIAHPFISPDESYLIWDSEREEGYGDSDLYISFRQKDGSWGPAINLGEGINTEREDIYGSVTPDGKYLFFHRYLDNGKVNIYWVNTQVIENLKKQQ